MLARFVAAKLVGWVEPLRDPTRSAVRRDVGSRAQAARSTQPTPWPRSSVARRHRAAAAPVEPPDQLAAHGLHIGMDALGEGGPADGAAQRRRRAEHGVGPGAVVREAV